jgi:hypothetical protein
MSVVAAVSYLVFSFMLRMPRCAQDVTSASTSSITPAFVSSVEHLVDNVHRLIHESRVEVHSSQLKLDKMQQDLEEAGRNVRYLADAAKRLRASISSSTETISPSQIASKQISQLTQAKDPHSQYHHDAASEDVVKPLGLRMPVAVNCDYDTFGGD